jgi:hypothetical protein
LMVFCFVLFCFVFQDRISQIICPGWLQTLILLISAIWVGREGYMWATGTWLEAFILDTVFIIFTSQRNMVCHSVPKLSHVCSW